MANFLRVNSLKRLNRLCGLCLAENLDHAGRDIEAARLQHHRHDCEPAHEIIYRVFRRAPHARMRRQGTVVAP